MSVNIQTIQDIRFYLARHLDQIYEKQEIAAITNIVIKTVIGTTRLQSLYMHEETVTPLQSAKIKEICNELLTGKPVQYILGETIFYDCIIKVNSSTLIPRPETEELVDLIIRENRGFKGDILDVGTGSGCIAIALALNLPGSFVSGLDISADAIRTAKENALLNKTDISFFTADIFDIDRIVLNKADIIVSNPPYVINSEKKSMSKNILDFEPPTALFVPDSDPLLYYRAIIRVAETVLLPKGSLYFEINEEMGKPISLLLESAGYSRIEIVTDINGKDRIIKGVRHG